MSWMPTTSSITCKCTFADQPWTIHDFLATCASQMRPVDSCLEHAPQAMPKGHKVGKACSAGSSIVVYPATLATCRTCVPCLSERWCNRSDWQTSWKTHTTLLRTCCCQEDLNRSCINKEVFVEAVDSLKQQPASYESHVANVQHWGGSLLASHGIISHVRWTFASECSLLCMPNLFNRFSCWSIHCHAKASSWSSP